jgi:hypothetical protein
MHRTKGLQATVHSFIVYPVRLAHFLSIIEVGDTSQCCSGSGHSEGQDDLRNRRRFAYSMQVVLGVRKRPYLPEAEKKSRRSAASAVMVQVGGWQKVKIFHKREGHNGTSRLYLCKRRFGMSSTSNSR